MVYIYGQNRQRKTYEEYKRLLKTTWNHINLLKCSKELSSTVFYYIYDSALLPEVKKSDDHTLMWYSSYLGESLFYDTEWFCVRFIPCNCSCGLKTVYLLLCTRLLDALQ